MSDIDIAIPDHANFDFGNDPIPDNFLDETISKAVTHHSRKESQMLSVQEDFSKIVDVNVASNLAKNLIENRSIVADHPPPIDPDEDDVRIGTEQHFEPSGPQLDDMLIQTVTEHQRKESRQDFLESKLHELFSHKEEEDDLGGGVGQLDMGLIANNMVAFLHDDDPETAAPTAINAALNQINQISGNNTAVDPQSPHKARGSTDLSQMQQELQRLQSTVRHLEYELSQKGNSEEELNGRVMELENTNQHLIKKIEYLQNSKTKLALESTKCIDELREMLVSYQTNLGLKQ